MKKSTALDLEDTCDALEHLFKRLPAMNREEKVDVGARLRAAFKTIEKIDKLIKEDIKLILDSKEGDVKGEVFKATLKVVPVATFDQKLFKEKEPKLHARYTEDVDQIRISYEPR